jgi:hypothetical protein
MLWICTIKTVLNRIEQKLDLLLAQQQKGLSSIMIDLTTLTAEVANNTAVDASVEQLLTNLTAQIAALANSTSDPTTQTALNGLVTTLQNNDTAIAAAVVANTPAAPAA